MIPFGSLLRHSLSYCRVTSGSVTGGGIWLPGCVRTGWPGDRGRTHGTHSLCSPPSVRSARLRLILTGEADKKTFQHSLHYLPKAIKILGSHQNCWSSNTAGVGTDIATGPICDARLRQDLRRVRVGGRGTVVLDVYSIPPVQTAAPPLCKPAGGVKGGSGDETARTNVVIYLPRGPFPNSASTHETDFETFLARLTAISGTSNVRVIRINYRLITGEAREPQADLRFPLAIHDVQCCFDYVCGRGDLCDPDARISIYGSHFGGGLALMLALTNPNKLHAVAAANPITDWTSLDDLVESGHDEINAMAHARVSGLDDASDCHDGQARGTKGAISKQGLGKEAALLAQIDAARELIDLRTMVFRHPSGFFDPFASPLLFLRAPGRDTPPWRTARPEQDPNSAATTATAFGPYDDDWQPKDNKTVEYTTSSSIGEQGELDTIAEAIGADLLQAQELDDTARSTSSMPSQASSVTSRQSSSERAGQRLVKAGSKTVRRRKVLQRWPPIGRPEDVDLPFVGILATRPRPPGSAHGNSNSDPDYATVLHPQAKDMAEVMRRACFWGREKSLGEATVNFEEFGEDAEDNGPIQQGAVNWLMKTLLEDQTR